MRPTLSLALCLSVACSQPSVLVPEVLRDLDATTEVGPSPRDVLAALPPAWVLPGADQVLEGTAPPDVPTAVDADIDDDARALALAAIAWYRPPGCPDCDPEPAVRVGFWASTTWDGHALRLSGEAWTFGDAQPIQWAWGADALCAQLVDVQEGSWSADVCLATDGTGPAVVRGEGEGTEGEVQVFWETRACADPDCPSDRDVRWAHPVLAP